MKYLPFIYFLICKFCGYKREVFPHLQPQIRFRDPSIVCMNSMDFSKLSGNESKKIQFNVTLNVYLTVFIVFFLAKRQLQIYLTEKL